MQRKINCIRSVYCIKRTMLNLSKINVHKYPNVQKYKIKCHDVSVSFFVIPDSVFFSHFAVVCMFGFSWCFFFFNDVLIL